MNPEPTLNYRKDRPRRYKLHVGVAAGVALLLALAFGWVHLRSAFKDDFDDLIAVVTVFLALPCFVGGLLGWLMWLDIRDRRRRDADYRGRQNARHAWPPGTSHGALAAPLGYVGLTMRRRRRMQAVLKWTFVVLVLVFAMASVFIGWWIHYIWWLGPIGP